MEHLASRTRPHVRVHCIEHPTKVAIRTLPLRDFKEVYNFLWLKQSLKLPLLTSPKSSTRENAPWDRNPLA